MHSLESAEAIVMVAVHNRPRVLRTVVLPCMAIGLLTALMVSAAPAQDLFSVKNPKKQSWPQDDANRIYAVAVESVAREFKLPKPVLPRFTLVLGYSSNQLDVNTGELRLEKWDRRLFADGVILFSVEQMLTPETRAHLLRRTLLAIDSTVAVDTDSTTKTTAAAQSSTTATATQRQP